MAVISDSWAYSVRVFYFLCLSVLSNYLQCT